MIECRALVESIGKARTSVEKLGGKFKGNYIFKDIIFVLRKKKSKKTDHHWSICREALPLARQRLCL
ncbi:MAG: hypothetical protein Q8R37_06095 [Nanoarchaeota archaeon]|nr:hypothetical protein [Nanoarchaeota archaeon]